jgi:Meiotically up-regulated gene 113
MGRNTRERSTEGNSVYFIRMGQFVKVGRSLQVGSRFDTLQSMLPVKLELLGVISGPPSAETALHKLLKDRGFHANGEWFLLKPALERAIKEFFAEAANV